MRKKSDTESADILIWEVPALKIISNKFLFFMNYLANVFSYSSRNKLRCIFFPSEILPNSTTGSNFCRLKYSLQCSSQQNFSSYPIKFFFSFSLQTEIVSQLVLIMGIWSRLWGGGQVTTIITQAGI
jgi:hypothetical protein